MNTQPRIIRVPPSIPPRTRNASGFFEPEDSRRPLPFWREVLGELKQMRWLGARDVLARTVVVVGLIASLTLFAMFCSSLARLACGA